MKVLQEETDSRTPIETMVINQEPKDCKKKKRTKHTARSLLP